MCLTRVPAHNPPTASHTHRTPSAHTSLSLPQRLGCICKHSIPALLHRPHTTSINRRRPEARHRAHTPPSLFYYVLAFLPSPPRPLPPRCPSAGPTSLTPTTRAPRVSDKRPAQPSLLSALQLERESAEPVHPSSPPPAHSARISIPQSCRAEEPSLSFLHPRRLSLSHHCRWYHPAAAFDTPWALSPSSLPLVSFLHNTFLA